MLSPSDFHDLISGQRRGPAATLWRMGLRAAEVPYTWAVSYRNLRFDRGHAEIKKAAVPVISVGNLTLGGTGKTPMIAWLARFCSDRGLRVGFVSRGYGSVDGQPNDEARELARLFPDIPHVQDKDRVAAANRILQDHDLDAILLDDGFQHRRLHRDLDIVLIDALQPHGFGHVFPRGSLREPLHGLRRADIAILTRADMVSEQRRREIQTEMLRVSPDLVWAEATHQAVGLARHDGDAMKIDAIETVASRRVFAFCAIGNPDGFFETLTNCKAEIVGRRCFPDHHHFEKSDLEELAAEIKKTNAEQVICTQKDLVKLETDEIGGQPLRALRIELAIQTSVKEIDAQLLSRLPV